jgi:serine/threonine protein kinase/tetratricopeptide (TPR) repeat protein
MPEDPDSQPTLGPEDDRPGAEDPSTKGSKRTLGPYQVRKEIGRGGMGVVYEAYHPQLKRSVALKALIAGEDASEEAIRRFHREAEAVAKLGHHPNIVPVHDIGQQGNVHYFAMHLVDGPALDALIDRGELDPRQAAGIALKLAEALHHAHRQGILHRDVKPANVLLTSLEGESGKQVEIFEGETGGGGGGERERKSPLRTDRTTFEPLLTDFGLAKDVASETQVTRSGMTLGTPNYMPPEQADGRLDEIDERADVYSLGATLYEMLTLNPPFEGTLPVNVIQKVLFESPKPPRKLNPSVAKDLETICLKCIEKDPKDRYHSARELAADLRRFLEGASVRAKPAPFHRKLVTKIRRHKGLTALSAGVILAGAVGAVVAVSAVVESRKESREATGRAVDAESDADQKESALREALRDSDEIKKAKEASDRRREKDSRVSKVVMEAVAKLDDVQARLKRTRFTSVLDPAEKKRLFAELSGKIEAFGSGVTPDPESQATLLAIKGWLAHLGGHEEVGRTLFERAREEDPDVAWGYLMEALFWLSKILAFWELRYAPESWNPDTPAAEIPEYAQKKLRREMEDDWRRFEQLMKDARGKCTGGGETESLPEVAEGLRSLLEDDVPGAEKGLTRALDHWALAWMREEILLARYKVRRRLEAWDGAAEDLRSLLARFPDSTLCKIYLTVLHTDRGDRAGEAGEDPIPWYEEAIREYTRLIGAHTEFDYDFRVSRAEVFEKIANRMDPESREPEAVFAKALLDLSEAIRRNAGLTRGHLLKGRILERMGLSDAALRAYLAGFASGGRFSTDVHKTVERLTVAKNNRAPSERNPEVFVARAKRLEQLGLFEEALAEYGEAYREAEKEKAELKKAEIKKTAERLKAVLDRFKTWALEGKSNLEKGALYEEKGYLQTALHCYQLALYEDKDDSVEVRESILRVTQKIQEAARKGR